MRRIVLTVFLVVALFAGACSGGGDGGVTVDAGGDEPRPTSESALEPSALLSQAVDNVTAATTYRFDMGMRMVVADGVQQLWIEPDEPVAHGEQAGGRTHVILDFAGMFESMAQQMGGAQQAEFDALFGGVSLTMEMVGDGTVLYLRSPFLAHVAELSAAEGGQGALLEPLAAIGDRWGRVDVAALGDIVPSELVSNFTGGSAIDPTLFRDMLTKLGTEVRDLGRTNIRGVVVTALAADVSYRDLLAAQGMDIEDLSGLVGGAAGQAAPDVVASLENLQLPIAVYVDDENLVRRIEFKLTLDDLAAAFPELAEEAASSGSRFEMSMWMDFSDYGDDSISVEVPDASIAVDLSDWFREAAGLFAGG